MSKEIKSVDSTNKEYEEFIQMYFKEIGKEGKRVQNINCYLVEAVHGKNYTISLPTKGDANMKHFIEVLTLSDAIWSI